MAQPPPRPAAARSGGPAAATSSAPSSSSSSGPRPKEPEKELPKTFFLGRYRVVDEIGVGGMASVHLARMDGPGGFQKWVAIKRIHPHLVEDDQFVDMFLDEARIAAGINHANVAQVFDLGKDDNTYWIAMEYLHGEPLREVMRAAEDRRMNISPELAARICADAAEGLHAAHELRGKNGQLLGLVHRDVTPHNLFVTYDGYTKVVDFGIAKVADRLASTRAGTLKGKLAYMSPEQVRGSDVDRTTDVFALGVVLWELTTNQRLFRMDTDLDTLEKVQACNVPPPSTIIRGYPQGLEQVVLKALAKNKKDRYATAREFSRALQGFLMQRGAFVGPEEVAQFVRNVFNERIAKREAHLSWAAEVTSNIDIDKLRAQQGGGDALEAVDSDDKKKGASVSKSAVQPVAKGASGLPAPNERSSVSGLMAADSLMDDDEDIPTTVATRDHMEKAAAAGALRMPGPADLRTGPKPAAGMPAYPQAGGRDERTAALPGLAGADDVDDLNSTIAMPANAKFADPGPPKNFGQTPRPNSGFGGYTPPTPSQPGFNGQPAPAQSVPPQYGFAPQPTPSYPPPGQQQSPATAAFPSVPPSGPTPHQQQQMAQAMYGRGNQSQIETAMSLPRPDPAQLWMAQQQAGAHQQKKNTGVLILVIALVALSIIGIGVLVFFKLKAPPPTPTKTPETVVAPSAVLPTVTVPPAATPAPTPPPAASATAPEPQATTAPPPATAPAGTTKAPTAATTTPPAATASAPSAGGGDPGFLTIVCNPFCDDVLDNGRSLGPSPIVHLSVKPGSHRVTLKKGTMSKTVSVIVVSGQVTAQRVSMK